MTIEQFIRDLDASLAREAPATADVVERLTAALPELHESVRALDLDRCRRRWHSPPPNDRWYAPCARATTSRSNAWPSARVPTSRTHWPTGTPPGCSSPDTAYRELPPSASR